MYVKCLAIVSLGLCLWQCYSQLYVTTEAAWAKAIWLFDMNKNLNLAPDKSVK